jgi:cobalt-zinc-cadmium efflux system outer membrane protein
MAFWHFRALFGVRRFRRGASLTPRCAPAVLLAAMFGGCAGVHRDAGFTDVQKSVADRIGLPVQWRGVTADDAAVDRSVHDLLARPLTDDTAVAIALLNNRPLQAAYEDLGVAQADLVQAGLLKNPVFTFDARFPDRSPKKTYLDISVEDDFIDIFLRPLRQKAAENAFAAAKARAESAVLQTAADTRAAFIVYQAAQQELELERTVNQAQSDSFDAAKRFYQSGTINELRLLGETSLLDRTRLELSTAEQRADEARQRLGNLMGIWEADANWTTAGRLPEPPEREVDPAGLESLAIRQRPDLEAARQDLLTQARTLGFTYQFRYLGSASAGPEAERETDGQWRVGPSFEVPLPLFDQGQAAVARATALLRQSQQRLTAAAIDVRFQVRLARTRLFNARARVDFYRREVLPIQTRLVDQTQLHFNGMYVGVFELLQAKRDQIAAGREYLGVLKEYWLARVELERAIGGRLPAATDLTR